MSIKKTSIVGASFPRVESRSKVTGAAQYVDDMQFGPNLLIGQLKRSSRPHALIKRLDVSKARALPGVRVVVTGEDFPGLTGLYLSDRPMFAVDRVRFVGEPLAGVAADTLEIAEEAIRLIEVEYEDLPGVFDPEFALQDHRNGVGRQVALLSDHRLAQFFINPARQPVGKKFLHGGVLV